MATTVTSLLHKYTNTDKCRDIATRKPPTTASTRVSVYTNTSKICQINQLQQKCGADKTRQKFSQRKIMDLPHCERPAD